MALKLDGSRTGQSRSLNKRGCWRRAATPVVPRNLWSAPEQNTGFWLAVVFLWYASSPMLPLN
ncbi:hypothetical protein ASPBRDRAFT_435559 [Aspergillus brasiliensis CBS 101740]|uniref:Uncharacterized protein n=1 Tax=Aspergillus brasiliensis (strain CBS 101740 / IMI 381727 / IBT 21946) TaxID=767769 RepID=A0A1L9U2H4_ASPBC|nr:hypothetical protein ASPBRDRAFT_435559 [Aspergillus brasiliensis CBS 101740]